MCKSIESNRLINDTVHERNGSSESYRDFLLKLDERFGKQIGTDIPRVSPIEREHENLFPEER